MVLCFKPFKDYRNPQTLFHQSLLLKKMCWWSQERIPSYKNFMELLHLATGKMHFQKMCNSSTSHPDPRCKIKIKKCSFSWNNRLTRGHLFCPLSLQGWYIWKQINSFWGLLSYPGSLGTLYDWYIGWNLTYLDPKNSVGLKWTIWAHLLNLPRKVGHKVKNSKMW